jgi:LysR family transcriptional regulator, nitrogen assimilation regulatory protein
MDIKQLRYFIAIAEEGSLSAAAQRVNVAQPSLSQHVIQLEQNMNVKLLERSPRGVSLTQSGEVLLAHAREIVLALDRAKEAVRSSGSTPQGDVAFGLPSSVSMVLSVPLAETVRLELPQVRLRAIEAMSGFIQTWLTDHTVDLGILYDISSIRHLSARQLANEDLHFFAAPDAWPFGSAPGSPVRLRDLRDVELILPSPQHGLRSLIDRHARSEGVSLRIPIEMDALAQIKTLVGRGSGYTILAPAAAIDRVERGELVMAPIVQPHLTRPVYLVRNPGKPLTAASRAVEEVTLAVIRDRIHRGIWNAQDLPA